MRGRLPERVRSAPLRMRLVALLGILLTGAALATGAAASLLLQHYLVQRQDAELSAAQSSLVKSALDEASAPTDTVVPAPRIVPVNTYVVRLTWADGRSHDAYTGTRAAPHWPTLTGHTSARPFGVDSAEGSDEKWRVVTGTTTDRHGARVNYAVAVSLSEVETTVHRLDLLIAGAALAVIPTTMVIGWFLVRRAFRPLAAIEDTAAAIADGDLTRRVPVQATHDEVGSLSRSLNTMLGHIETSFAVREASEERMRRFVADASHELRTPLVTVRGYAELYRQGAVSGPADTASAMLRIENEATRMAVLVDDLLLLTRLDRQEASAPAEQPFAPVDLTVIATDAVQDGRALAPGRDIRLRGLSGAVEPTMTTGSEARLRQVATNLISNAVRYSPADSPIEVVVGHAPRGTVQLQVRDHGPGIPEHLRSKVFERFYRADSSRNSASGGSGLGLAIVQAIADSHRGTIEVVPTDGGGATFVLTLRALTE